MFMCVYVGMLVCVYVAFCVVFLCALEMSRLMIWFFEIWSLKIAPRVLFTDHYKQFYTRACSQNVPIFCPLLTLPLRLGTVADFQLVFQGVPIRIEFGPRDLQNNQFVAVRRDTGEKVSCHLIGSFIFIRSFDWFAHSPDAKGAWWPIHSNFRRFCQFLLVSLHLNLKWSNNIGPDTRNNLGYDPLDTIHWIQLSASDTRYNSSFPRLWIWVIKLDTNSRNRMQNCQ